MSSKTVAVEDEVHHKLMRLQAERLNAGERVSFSDIINSFLPEPLEAQATDELPKRSTDLQKTIVLIKQKLAAGSIKRKDLTKTKLMDEGFLESEAEEILEVVTG